MGRPQPTVQPRGVDVRNHIRHVGVNGRSQVVHKSVEHCRDTLRFNPAVPSNTEQSFQRHIVNDNPCIRASV